MQQSRPLHSQRSRTSLIQLITPFLVSYLLVLGIAQGGDLFILFLAVLLALYFALTFHVGYDLYGDAVVIRYLAPRRRAVYLSNIQEVGLINVPLRGETLLIRQHNGGPLFIRPSDPTGFLARLNELRQ
jgi:hypothetical protein